MNNKNHSKAKILTLIPIIVFALTSICLIPLIISYFSTGSDVTAVAIIFLGSLSLILTAVPCLVMSILGTIFASKAKAEGITASHKFFVIGIIEISVYGLGVICTIVAALIMIVVGRRW